MHTSGINADGFDEVAEAAEQAYAALDDADQRAARGLLLRLAPLGGGADGARRRLPLVEMEDPDQVGALARVLDAFERALAKVGT